MRQNRKKMEEIKQDGEVEKWKIEKKIWREIRTRKMEQDRGKGRKEGRRESKRGKEKVQEK